MPLQRVPRIRLRGVPDDGVFVIRGDELDASLIVEDATRFYERFVEWRRYGISAFHAASEAEIDVLCQTRLIRFATVVVFRWTDSSLPVYRSCRRSVHRTYRSATSNSTIW